MFRAVKVFSPRIRFRHSVILLSALAALCVSTPLHSVHAAQRAITFKASELENPFDLDLVVKKLKEGQTVIFENANGRKIKYRLGPYLGGGEMGRVFLIDGRTPKQVIKFQVGYTRARDFMLREYEALNFLIKEGLPAAKVAAESDSRLFLIKDYVEGPTLQKMLESWTRFPEKEQLLMFRALAQFMTKVEKSGIKIGDLKASNVMFDPLTKKWLIMDPSSAVQKGSPQRLGLIEDALVGMSRTSLVVKLAREHPEWLEREVRLRGMFREAIQDGSTEAMEGCLLNYEKFSTKELAKAPVSFQALWAESLAAFKYSLPRTNGYPVLKKQYDRLLESSLKVLDDKSSVSQVLALAKSSLDGSCLRQLLKTLQL